MEKPQKMPRVAKVKNKAPAEIQITAEQLIREAYQLNPKILPRCFRKAFEDSDRKNRLSIATGIEYARREKEQKQIDRARLDLTSRKSNANLKILAQAKAWARLKAQREAEEKERQRQPEMAASEPQPSTSGL